MLVTRSSVLVLVLAALLHATVDVACQDDVKVTVMGEDAVSSAVRVFTKFYSDCSRKKDGLTGCIKMKAITFFDRVSRAGKIPLSDEVVLVKKDASSFSSSSSGTALTEAELEAVLSTDSTESRAFKLDNILMDTMAKFFNSHSLQINFPKMDGGQLQRGIEEGRGKMKKMMGMMMMGMAMKMAGLIPIAIAGLFLLAGKALIVSKIALVLSLIIALKKILSQKQGGHESHSSGGHGGGWDRRSMLVAHDMAYRGQRPAPTQG